MGDDVQALKAGIMESADVFAVNKADRDGADATVRDIELVLALGRETMLKAGRGHVVHGSAADAASGSESGAASGVWTAPIVRTVATRGDGTGELVDALEKHRAWLEGTDTGRERRRARLGDEMREALREALIDAATHDLRASIEQAVQDVDARRIDPYSAIERLVGAFRAR
jgi:LAO/AO transport system kinase